jgi:hypothetical protein
MPAPKRKEQRGHFLEGVRHAVKILAGALELREFHKVSYTEDGGTAVTLEWLGHLVATDGVCSCKGYASEFTGYHIEALCDDWSDVDFRRAWYCEWHDITIEQLAAKERAEMEAKLMAQDTVRRRTITYHRDEIERLMKKEGVVVHLPGIPRMGDNNDST